MVVTDGIERAIQYFLAIRDYLARTQEPLRAIVAFSGEQEYGGEKVTRGEAERISEQRHRRADSGRPVSFPDLRRQVSDRLRRAAAAHDVRGQGSLRHQGGADTLTLNRAHPKKHDVFVLDFMNDTETIKASFAPTTGRRSSARRPTRTNCTISRRRSTAYRSITGAESMRWWRSIWTAPAGRSWTRSWMRAWRSTSRQLDEDGQVEFKGKAKAFTRTYDFLASILPYTNAGWEKLSIFLNFLIPKLPAPKEEDREGHPRSHRHGQLPGGEAGGDDDSAAGRDAEIDPVPMVRAGTSRSPSWIISATSSRCSTSNLELCSRMQTAWRSESRMTSPRRLQPTRHTSTLSRTRPTPLGSNWTPR